MRVRCEYAYTTEAIQYAVPEKEKFWFIANAYDEAILDPLPLSIKYGYHYNGDIYGGEYVHKDDFYSITRIRIIPSVICFLTEVEAMFWGYVKLMKNINFLKANGNNDIAVLNNPKFKEFVSDPMLLSFIENNPEAVVDALL